MRAAVGDVIVVQAAHLAERVRHGEIIEVRGADGGPPYLVRWAGEEHETLVSPGPDARIERTERG